MRRGFPVLLATVVVGGALIAFGFVQPAAAAPAPQVITIYVYSSDMKIIQDPDGTYHDAFVPFSFVLRAGVPVTLRFVNYDDMPHTMTSPDLGLDITIQAGLDMPTGSVIGGITTYTFTPTKKGTFRWYCAKPCDNDAGQWAMKYGDAGPGKVGYMAGYIDIH